MDGPVLTCYADYDVHEYLLGAGPTTLTVAYDRMAKGRSYDLYRRSHAVGRYGDAALLSKGACAAAAAATAAVEESNLLNAVGGRESVVFLVPMGAHNAIAVEAWQAVEQWDLQTDEDDVVHAVALRRARGRP